MPGDQFYISGCCYFHFTDSLPKLMSGKHTKHKEFANFGLGVAVVYPTSVNYYQFGMEFGSFEERWSCQRERPKIEKMELPTRAPRDCHQKKKQKTSIATRGSRKILKFIVFRSIEIENGKPGFKRTSVIRSCITIGESTRHNYQSDEKRGPLR